jgi:hypothetical protein
MLHRLLKLFLRQSHLVTDKSRCLRRQLTHELADRRVGGRFRFHTHAQLIARRV